MTAPPIDEFKKRYGTVYLTHLGDLPFIWRPLSRPEYDTVVAAAQSEQDFDERLCQAAVLWPSAQFAEGEAGVPKNLAPHIKEMSGFSSPKTSAEMLEAFREEINVDFTAQAEVTIKAAFPEITFEQMTGWPIDRLMQTLARAEWKLNNVDLALFSGRRIEFQVTQPDAEEAPSLKEQAAAMREQGVDPMLQLDMKKLSPPYVEKPLILGTRWQDEVIWNGVSEQVQRLSEQRKAKPALPQR